MLRVLEDKEVILSKRIALSLLLLITAEGFLSHPGLAQTQSPCFDVLLWYWPDPQPLGWFAIGPGQGNYSYVIGAPNLNCPPPPCDRCAAQAQKPIILADGNTFITQFDLSVPGLGGGLNLTRTWNALWPTGLAAYSMGMFGNGWHSTYEESIFQLSGNDRFLHYLRGDAEIWSFAHSPEGWTSAAPGNAGAGMVQVGSTVTIFFHNGEQRQFGPTGQLLAIIDRNGNTTQLSYDSSHRLITVTSPASQHLYFTYGNSNFSTLVTCVRSDFGVSLSYAYDTYGRLTQVTKPDLTTISFTYNDQSEITAVTDSNGKILESHTYDSSGRGLTASQANGVNAVSVGYPN